ncbi:hypothetical protein O9X98_13975 [Agrobacterium salinitolerans]|nr:hypothetical protein [Agrobacterium salinitolerans]
MKIMDIDEAIYDLCRGWYDSETTPVMYAVAFRASGDKSADVDVSALFAEINACRKECDLTGEDESLTKACEILRRLIERDEVFLKIVELAARAKEAGLDRREFEVACGKAWEKIT